MAKEQHLGLDLTEGNITRKLLQFMLPFLIASVLQAAYSTVDLIVVGQFVGSVGTVAISQGGRVTMFFTCLAMGFAGAGQVFIGQQTGARDHAGVSHTIGNLFTLLAIIAATCLLIGVLLCKQMVAWMNTPVDAMEQTTSYLLICSIGYPFVFGYNAVCGVLRGMGDSKRPLYFVAVASVVNLALDLLFVAVLDFASAGAAWATVIGQAVSFIVAIVHLYRRRDAFGFDFKPKSFALLPHYSKTILRLGMPMSLQYMLITLSQVVITVFVNDYGLAAAAAWGVGDKIFQLTSTVDTALLQAGAAMIAQNLGAGKTDRAKQVVHRMFLFGLVLAIVNTLWMLPLHTPLYRLFNNDPEVLAYSFQMVAVVVCAQYLAAVMGAVQGMTTGSGAAGRAFFAGLCDSVIFRFGFCFLLGYGLNLGMVGFYIGSNFARLGPILVCGTYYLSGKWKTRSLVQPKAE